MNAGFIFLARQASCDDESLSTPSLHSQSLLASILHEFQLNANVTTMKGSNFSNIEPCTSVALLQTKHAVK